LGLKVPDDISIIGFDDIPQAAFTCPALTTIFQPKLEMGREGVALLLEEINEPTNPIKKKISLPVKLIIRETTAPPSW